MAEDSEGFSNPSSENNSDSEDFVRNTTSNAVKPDLGFENVSYNATSSDQVNHVAEKTPSTPIQNPPRKEENPFSFRHFLKRDLSLPGSTSYENTGAKPKVYSSTVQHSPSKLDSPSLSRRILDNDTKEKGSRPAYNRRVNNNGSSVDVSVNNNSSARLYPENDAPFYNRANGPTDPLGMPSLPDFVQDHILVEQAYLNSNAPLNLDLDNLPDFTFNTGYNQAVSADQNINISSFTNGRGYSYDANQPSSSNEPIQGSSIRPSLDLGVGEREEASGVTRTGQPPLPLDLANHFNLDLTESVNPADRRSVPQRLFPLDLTPNTSGNANQSGTESLRLPDFLPVHSSNRQSPEREGNQNRELELLRTELELMRSQLISERQRSTQLERDLSAARTVEDVLREELRQSRMVENNLRGQVEGVCQIHELPSVLHDEDEKGEQKRTSETDATITSLRIQIKQLKAELRDARKECDERGVRQQHAARSLAAATNTAELSLRDLLSGLDALRGLCSTLDPP